MALYFGEEQEKYKGTAYSKKKVIRLITGIKKYESCRHKFKKIEFLQ
jgi:hypothetical protein